MARVPFAVMARRYFVRPLPAPGPFSLPKEVAHHIGRVLRGSRGQKLILFDGNGGEARCEITEASQRSVQVDVLETYTSDKEPLTRLSLAFALPKGQRADQIFEHGTEIGIAQFFPLWTERSQRRSKTSTSRWERIVQAASGQCDRALIPTIHEAEALQTFLAREDLPRERYTAAFEAPALAAASTNEALLLIGPEGGLSQAELDILEDLGFAGRSLGALTLRTETAVLVGAARLLQ